MSPPQKRHKQNLQPQQNKSLLEIAEDEDVATAKALLEGGSDVNSYNKRGERLLHWAAANCRLRLLKYLLSRGAHLDAKCNNGNSALSIAAKSGSAEIIETLILTGAEINVVNLEGKCPLHIAASKDNTDAISKLIELGANVHIRDKNGQTPLYTAVCHDSLSITKILLEAGADVNAKSNNGNTALHVASQCHRTEIVKALLEKGAEVNIKNSDGDTPLSAAATEGDLGIIKLLLEAGADVDERDKNGRNALHAVISIPIYLICHVTVCKELIFAGSDVLSRENPRPLVRPVSTGPAYLNTEVNGRTPLHSSMSHAYQRRISVPKMIIKKILLINPRATQPDYVDNDPALSRCWQTSKVVVEKMICVKLANSSVTLQKFLLESDVSKLAGYLSSGNSVVQDELINCAKLFRTYGEMIRYQLNKGSRRIRLLHAVNIVLNHSEAKDLPNEIRNKIFIFLTNLSLKNIIKAGCMGERPSAGAVAI